MRTSPALLALALVLGASACEDHKVVSQGPEPVLTQLPTPTPTPAPTTPPFPADTSADDGGPGSGSGLGLVGVRAARQAGFDRVTFELDGEGAPGWHVAYTSAPTADGSGAPVSVKGSSVLSVVLIGIGLPDDTGVPPLESGTDAITPVGTSHVLEIVPGTVFEGRQQAFIGLSGGKRPFRVFALTGPPRVVVDVRDS